MNEKKNDHELIREGDNVVIATVSCQAEADLIEDALKAEGVQVMVQTFESTALDGVFTPGRGWGNVQVLEHDRERAEAIVADVRKNIENQQDDETEDDEDE